MCLLPNPVGSYSAGHDGNTGGLVNIGYRHIGDPETDPDEVLRFLTRHPSFGAMMRPGVTVDEFMSEFRFQPRWCDAQIAFAEDGGVIGYISYSVCSSAFAGGNDYYVMSVVLDHRLTAEDRAQVHSELLRRSEADDDW